MKLILYADGKSEAGDRLLQKIEDQVSADIVEAYRSLDDFKQGLLQHRQKPNVAILMAANATELKRIITLGKLLTDMRILLVLPDRRKETVAAGYRLWPRYISYADNDLEDVVAVVKQILKLLPVHGTRDEGQGDEVSSIVKGSEATGRPSSIVKK